MVGPSRVGKTSLITALLRDGQRLLEGTPVSMRAIGTPTQRRLAQHRRDLDGALLAGEFDPGALGGSQEQFTFQLLLDPGVPGAGIELQLLDYPGGWLDPVNRPADREAQWEECERFLEQASVLIVPIDAAVLMEATATIAPARGAHASWPSRRSPTWSGCGSSAATSAPTSRRCCCSARSSASPTSPTTAAVATCRPPCCSGSARSTSR